MKLGATESIKFKKLKMRLSLSHWQAVGLLESLWMFTSRNSPAGDIGRHSDEDIAAAIEWPGDPTALITALVDCRWIDLSDESRLVVHDWADHMPNWLKGNIAAARAKKSGPQDTPKRHPKGHPEERAKDSPKDRSTEQSAEGSSYSYHSIPSQAIPLKEKSHAPERKQTTADALTFQSGPTPRHKEFYASYPRRMKPGDMQKSYDLAVFKLIERGMSDDEAHAFLIRRALEYAASPAGKDGIPDVRPAPAKWLDGERWDDDDSQWKIPNGNNSGGSNSAGKASGRFTGAEVDNDLAGLIVVGAKSK